MRKNWLAAAIALAFAVLSASCMSTRVYTKTDMEIYENDILVGRETSLERDGKLLRSETLFSHELWLDGDVQVQAVTETSSKTSYNSTSIAVFRDGELLAEDTFRTKGERIVKRKNAKPARKMTEEEREKDALLLAAYEAHAKIRTDDFSENGRRSYYRTVEEVQVDSSPNKKYIAYSVFGKPFVILGSTAWNLISAVGYAFTNFASGYFTMTQEGVMPLRKPDVAGAKARAQEARKNNGISAYPEYHLPFTDNHIAVTTVTSEVTNVFSSTPEVVRVISQERLEYDNTISVSLSSKADAHATAAVIGRVGAVVTLPISVVTYAGGAVAGVYTNLTGKNKSQ